MVLLPIFENQRNQKLLLSHRPGGPKSDDLAPSVVDLLPSKCRCPEDLLTPCPPYWERRSSPLAVEPSASNKPPFGKGILAGVDPRRSFERA
jgi:hypothetical protein